MVKRVVTEEKKKEMEDRVQVLLLTTPEHHLPKAIVSLMTNALETSQESWFRPVFK